MKKQSLALCLGSLAMLVTPLLTSCGGSGNGGKGEKIDTTKTQIKVGTFNGGFGMDWLNEAKARFEEKYATTSFEEGKTGVQVLVYGNKSDYTGTSLSGRALDKDIYFTEMVDILSFINAGKIADITDIVKEDLGNITDGAEAGKTIEGKLDPAFKSYFTQVDGNYYALPFYDGVYGIVCDVDYFSKNQWMFDEDGDFCSEKFANAGLDGIKGTYDDGLPRNVNEWQQLCAKIKDSGVIPFCYYGADAESYVNEAAKSIWTTVEGKEKFNTSLSFRGELDLVKPETINIAKTNDPETGAELTNGTYETEKVQITDANLYEVQRTPGKLEMFRFIDEVVLGAGNYKKNKSTFLDMQRNFIETPEYADAENDRYAMTFDGAWWQNEAKDVFQTLENAGRKGAMERRFVFMPVPTQNGIKDQVIMSANESFAFVNKNAEHLDLAKLLFQFLHTDNEMQLFTKSTATSRALNYSIPESWLEGNDLSYFTKSMIYLKNHSEFVYPYSANPIVGKNYSKFDFRGEWPFSSTIHGTNTKSPFVYLRDNQTDDAVDYFKGSLAYFNTDWYNKLIK
ncbi:MAG: hypothetical protein MJ248_03325 [Bacilli bacterium]|nr:hypothetical protein [Bacilli bacterium]